MNDIKQCVYKYVYDDQIIYIGKTNVSLKQRIYGHSKEDKFQEYLNKAKVYYAVLKNSTETAFVELYLINKYKPILNTNAKCDGDSNIFMEEPIWESWEELAEENAKLTEPESKKIKQYKPIKRYFTIDQLFKYGTELITEYRHQHIGNFSEFFTKGEGGEIEIVSLLDSDYGTHRVIVGETDVLYLKDSELRQRYKNAWFVPMAFVEIEIRDRRDKYILLNNLKPLDKSVVGGYPGFGTDFRKLLTDYSLCAELSRVLGFELELQEFNIEMIGAK